MPMQYNDDDEDQLYPVETEEQEPDSYDEPMDAAPAMAPAPMDPMPSTPRDPDDPKQKLKEYFERQDKLQKQNRMASRDEANVYRQGNADTSFAQLLNHSANQIGTIGGKTASSEGLDQFSNAMKKSNLQDLQLAQGERKFEAQGEDRKLKMMEYMRRNGLAEQSIDMKAKSAKKAQENSDRNYKLQKEKLDKKGQGEDGGELLTGVPERLWNKATVERQKLDEHEKISNDIKTNLEEMAGIGGKEGYIPGWLGGKSAVYDTLKANVSAAIVGKVAGIRSDKDYENIVVPMLPAPGTTPEDAKKKVQIFMNWLASQAPETPVLDNYKKHTKAPLPVPAPKAASATSKPLHEMTREEKLKELQELGDG